MNKKLKKKTTKKVVVIDDFMKKGIWIGNNFISKSVCMGFRPMTEEEIKNKTKRKI